MSADELANLRAKAKLPLTTQLLDHIDTLREENARLREALEWYANPSIYKPHPHGMAFDRRDLSFHARAALKGTAE